MQSRKNLAVVCSALDLPCSWVISPGIPIFTAVKTGDDAGR